MSTSNRTTKADLEAIVQRLNAITEGNYSIDGAYGGFRLVSGGGGRDISPRLTKSELAGWIEAFIAGFDAGKTFALTRAFTRAFPRVIARSRPE